MKRTRVTALLLFFGALLSCDRLSGQAGSGEVTGEVRDASGALVANARVTLTQSETRETYTTVSSAGGVYSFASLKPGRYVVSAVAAGFKRLRREGVVV